MRFLAEMDLDFGYLLAASGSKAPSVILFRLDDESSEMVNSRLEDVVNRCSADLDNGAIISVNEKAIRVRQLPISS